MKNPSRRRLLTGIGTATAVVAAGCVSETASEDDSPAEENTPATGENSTGDTTLPSSLQTGLSYIYPTPKQETILRTDTAEDEWPDFPAMPSSEHYVTEDSTVNLTVEIQGLGPGEENPVNPSPGAVYVGSIEIKENDYIEPKGTARGFDRYRISGNDNRGPIYFANNGDELLADSEPWVEATLDKRDAGADTYIESNTDVQGLLNQFEPVGYNIVLLDGQSLIEQNMAGRERELTTVPEVIAMGARRNGESTTRLVAMGYASVVGETERKEFPALAEAAYGVQNAEPETQGDGHILVFETTD
jgi:hypothetical protein